MKVKNIHSDWGNIIELDSPEEFFKQGPNHWRDLIYSRKLLFFKTVNFTEEDYAEFSVKFGKPWNSDDYKYSQEFTRNVHTRHGQLIISPFNTKIVNKDRISMLEMPWHADIPNRQISPFPFRSLWITSNPNPTISGRTIWLNVEKAVSKLNNELLDLAKRIRVVQQSWYNPGTDIQEFDFLKRHPITGELSLRLNWFCRPDRLDAWIKEIKIDGIVQPDNRILQQYFDYLKQFDDLFYEHIWDTKDISIYDNWPLLHRRTKLVFNPEVDYREFLRINIDHVPDADWPDHVNTYEG